MAASYCVQFGVHTVTQSSPSPPISCTQNAPHIADVSRITSADSVQGHSSSSSHGSTASRVLKDVHISAQLMEDFLALAEDNTNKDLETCAVLGAFLRGGVFYVTTLIIPKQESSSNSCQALNEEEIFFIQNELSLFPVGWIHSRVSTRDGNGVPNSIVNQLLRKVDMDTEDGDSAGALPGLEERNQIAVLPSHDYWPHASL